MFIYLLLGERFAPLAFLKILQALWLETQVVLCNNTRVRSDFLCISIFMRNMSTFLTSEKRSVPGVRKENSLLQHQTTIVEFILLSQLFLRLRKTSTLVFFRMWVQRKKNWQCSLLLCNFLFVVNGFFNSRRARRDYEPSAGCGAVQREKTLLAQGRRQVAQSNSTRQVLKRDQQLPKLDDFDNWLIQGLSAVTLYNILDIPNGGYACIGICIFRLTIPNLCKVSLAHRIVKCGMKIFLKPVFSCRSEPVIG